MGKAMDVKNISAMVVGMGISGIACADVLLDEGAHVIMSDSSDSSKFPEVMQHYQWAVQEGRIEFVLGESPESYLDCVELIVLSPGVPMNLPFIQQAIQQGIEVIGEIELGYRFSKAPIIAITGTNGKTTTTALTGEVFRSGGKNTYVLGNIGIPIIELARETTENDVIVAEVAGFQLESIRDFHSPCCAVLNISEDHLNRFGTMEKYIASKERILENQTSDDIAVLNADDPVVAAMKDKTKAQVVWFSLTKEIEHGASVKQNQIVFCQEGQQTTICDVHDLKIPGAHNIENALAAVCLGMAFQLSPQAIADTLRTFEGVEHRIEFVREVAGVRYINDSKGTNPDSTIKAVEAMERPTILLLGGSNKNSDYCPVFEAFQGNIKAVVALGETRDQIVRDAKKTGYMFIHVCDTSLEDAVQMAANLADKGDNVLLSPACASYDMFQNFEERGHVFKEIVQKL